MTNSKAFKMMCQALVIGAVFALAVLIYGLYAIGVSPVAFLFGFSTALLVLAVIVFGGMVTRSREGNHEE